jgi:hypothetical protein
LQTSAPWSQANPAKTGEKVTINFNPGNLVGLDGLAET